MHRSFIAFLLICFASAALAQSPPPPKKTVAPVARAKSSSPNAALAVPRPSVCVVSLIGNKFEVQTIGLMVFGNSLETVDITSWDLDDLVVRKVSAIAGSHFAVRRLILNKTALAAYQAPRKSILQGGPLFRDANKEFVDLLKDAAASGPRCDLFLAIRRSTGSYGNTNQYLEGIGILNHDTGIFSAQILFSILDASVYEGTTYEQRAIKFVRTGPAIDLGEALTGPGIHGLYRRLDKSWLPNPPQAAAQNQKLRDATWALLAQT